MPKAFYVIEDHTIRSIWSGLVSKTMLTLPSKPRGWDEPENTRPEGDWTLAHGLHTMASDGAYRKAGIPKPNESQLPAIFCVDGTGVRQQYQVSAEEAANFIRRNLNAL